MKENLQQPKSCFKEKNTRIRKFKSTSRFFQHAFDINSGIHSTQQRVREPDDLKLNPSDQERRNKEQVIDHNKDNTNTNSINGKFEISVIANCINKNFENINNSAMKDTEKDVRRKVKIIHNVSENYKNAPLRRFRKTIKPILNVILKMV